MEYDMTAQNELIILLTILGIAFLSLMLYIYYSNVFRQRFTVISQSISIFILFAAIGLFIRIITAYDMPGYATDVECFLAWSEYAYTGGFASFYNGDFFADYPPLYIYILSLIGALRDIGDISIMSADSMLLIRVPAFICDIILSCFIFVLARKKINDRAGLFLSALILFNPAVIINSALWGQVDVIITLLMVVCLYSLCKNRLVASAIIFMIAILLKPQAVMISPILLFVFVRNIIVSHNKVKACLILIASVIFSTAVFLIIPLPFGIGKEPLWLFYKLKETVEQYPQATLNAFNIYGLSGLNFLPATDYKFIGIPLNIWGYISIALVCILAGWLYFKNPDKRYLFALAAFVVLGIFTFSCGMHERYLFPVPILLLFAYIYLRDARLFICVVLNFAVLLLNQAVSMYYYQVYLPNTLTIVFSAISLAIFFYTFYVIIMLALYMPIVLKEPKPVLIKSQNHSVATEIENFEFSVPFCKKDIYAILIITALYSCIAFTNLGSINVPQTDAKLDNDIIINLGKTNNISKLRYYGGFGEGKFNVSYSSDGVNYVPAPLQIKDEVADTIEHDQWMLYKWQDLPTAIQAQYIKLSPFEGELPVLEVALFDENGDLISPYGASYADGKHISELFDEQDFVPELHDYMSEFYFDELYHVRTAYENIHNIQPYEITHPPLGKLIITLGIKMFGMNAFGWRFMGALTGVLMIAPIYLLAKWMTKSIKYSTFAAILLSVDFMHYAQTRIGTIDSYSVLWIILMYLFMYWYSTTNFNCQNLSKTLLPLFLCGLFFGIGAATKWLCIYAGLGLLSIFIYLMYKRYKEYRFSKTNSKYIKIAENYKKKLFLTLCWCILFFIIIPIVIYIASYIPYFQVTDGYAYKGLSDIIDNQKYMLNYHATLNPETVHPFSSKWYTWLLDIRPVLFFSEQNQQTNMVSTLSTMGNPLIWWSAIVAVFYMTIVTFNNKTNTEHNWIYAGVAALSELLPWVFVSREVFIYHYFGVVPFLIIIIIFWLKNMEEKYKYGKEFGYIYIIACVGLFFIFYPVITGVWVDNNYAKGLRWLQSWPFY